LGEISPNKKEKKIPTCWIELKITEGKNRQVRKMTAAISSPTLRLVRVSVADYKLDTLMPGEYAVIES
jgi:23S rRNA pseudouridine2457 synthase